MMQIRNREFIQGKENIDRWNHAYEAVWNATHHNAVALAIRSLRSRKPRIVGLKLNCRVVARTPNGRIFGIRETDLGCKQLAQIIQLNLLDTNGTIKDTSAGSNAETENSAATLPRILAGTGLTGANWTDYKMQTWTDDSSHRIAATINAVGSGTFTVTGVITNGSAGDIAYAEVGIDITVNGHIYLLAHDVGTAYTVSPTGTLTVTYTWTFT